MKKSLVYLAAGLFLSFGVLAQRSGNRPSPKDRAERQAKVMKVDLDLNESQYEQVVALYQRQAEKMKAEMQDRREEMREAREAHKAELQKILTKEQFEKHEAMMKERMQKQREARKRRP